MNRAACTAPTPAMPASAASPPLAARSTAALFALRILVGVAVLWVAGGAACYRRTRVNDLAPPPEIFQAVPTLEELTAAVNRTDAIQKLQSNSASVMAPSMSDVSLNATLVLERPKRFRMKASVRPLPTTLVDLGSNDQLFWMQIADGMTHTLFYATHERYRQQPVRSVLPVDPSWLIDALGLVHIDPATVTEGPIRRPDGQLEVRSVVAMSDGAYRRVCVIHEKTGVVTEQYLYGSDNNLVARAIASQHRYYPEQQCALPLEVQIHLQPAGGPPLMLEMKVGEYAINQILSGDPQLFVMPENAGNRIDLADVGGAAPYTVPPPELQPQQALPLPSLPQQPSPQHPGYPQPPAANQGWPATAGIQLPPALAADAPAAHTADVRYADPQHYAPPIRGF